MRDARKAAAEFCTLDGRGTSARVEKDRREGFLAGVEWVKEQIKERQAVLEKRSEEFGMVSTDHRLSEVDYLLAAWKEKEDE